MFREEELLVLYGCNRHFTCRLHMICGGKKKTKQKPEAACSSSLQPSSPITASLGGTHSFKSSLIPEIKG